MSRNPYYLMENAGESQRLQTKTDIASTREQLLLTGLGNINSEFVHIVDAGCGAGVVSKVMGEVASQKYKHTTLTLLDASDQRLNSARVVLEDSAKINYRFYECNLSNIPLETNSVDYVFCRFVFEYLSDPKTVLSEIVRIAKPGGKIVVGDLDFNCLNHYPLNPEIESNLQELMSELSKRKLLDPYVGRKLYHMFLEQKLQGIKINMIPHHLFYGPLAKSDEINWTSKLDQMLEVVPREEIKLSFDIKIFKAKFLDFLRSPERFSYTPLILVEGIKGHAR